MNQETIKILTWNMDYWRRNAAQRAWAWKYLKETCPDIAILQECNPDGQRFDTRNLYYHPVQRDWGSAIVMREGYSVCKHSFSSYHAGSSSLMCYDLFLPHSLTTLTIINVYGKQDAYGFCSTTMHHILSDLTPLLVNNRNKLMLLAGDFNVSPQWDQRHHDPSHQLVFDRLGDLGLKSCTSAFLGENVPTHVDERNPQNSYQLDYIYTTPSLLSKVGMCRVHDKNSIAQASDHLPIEVHLLL
jgi:endonuclease/exonuclease/phosphatase family metal-dependent hydrolase